SASVAISGVDGSFKLHGFSSRITLEDTVGPVRADTFSGPVEIRTKGWREGQDLDVKTFSGSIWLQLPGDASGTLTFDSFSGRLDSALRLLLKSSHRRSLTAELGGGASRGGQLRFKTFSGNLEINRMGPAERPQ